MNTATMVSQIEKLLPPIQKREWALRKQKTESKSIPLSFKEFLNFLLEEKSALEYMESDLRLSGQDITLSVTKVGNVTEHVQSKEYVIPLTDLRGKIWTIKAYGMEEVTAECGKCAIGQSQHSIREERELNIIKSGMTHDEELQQWIVNYPWIKNPNNLPNNVNSAVSRLGSTEKRLLRNSLEYASAYDEQIMDMVKRGIARKLTKGGDGDT
ncbi:unnamed protein product [Mytilus coruscus]|uniref:Uncharacterized protein n=1 Tax=Mytilus coruscus TaxID=42192 RepID=A0A6J8BDK0_MYTCO|nr:unnamed protein product [Mytilus coruscus]